jgi:hypothetical protein
MRIGLIILVLIIIIVSVDYIRRKSGKDNNGGKKP